MSGSPPATTTTISGLTPGMTYTFKVQASNPNGSGPVSAAVQPGHAAGLCLRPGAPPAVSASGGELRRR